MYYSLTFCKNPSRNDSPRVNTWDDWRLIPDSPPIIPTPEPKLNLVEIPGLAEGALDLTRVPFGVPQYNRMSGNWNFILGEEYIKTRVQRIEILRQYFKAETTYVKLEDQPQYWYKGIFILGTPKIGANTMQIQIGFNLEPRRYLVSNNQADTNYP